jgi:hypothetical protein
VNDVPDPVNVPDGPVIVQLVVVDAVTAIAPGEPTVTVVVAECVWPFVWLQVFTKTVDDVSLPVEIVPERTVVIETPALVRFADVALEHPCVSVEAVS